jgi:FlaA1/EpsC-like NDP-sugar epimerase
MIFGEYQMSHLDKRIILVTGGTGSFGRKFVTTVPRKSQPEKIVCNRFKQHEMRQTVVLLGNGRLRANTWLNYKG